MDSRNNKPVFHRILFMEMAPWLEGNKPVEKFAALINKVKKCEPDFSPRYNIEFPYRPFNSKTIYYRKLIINESVAWCNAVFHLLKDEPDYRVQKYWRNEILEKRIPGWFIESGKILKEKQYSIDYLDSQKYPFNMDEDRKTETYIMQLLKIALIWVYLEIQGFFSFVLQGELLAEEDFYIRFLFEPVPAESYVKELPEGAAVKENIKKEAVPDKVWERFPDCSFTCTGYPKSADKINCLFQSLKDSGFIAEDTTFLHFYFKVKGFR